MTDDEELSEAYNLGYSCAKDMVKDEITRLRAENEKLRKALNGWQEWWELPREGKRPDIAELIYRRAAAAIRESGDE